MTDWLDELQKLRRADQKKRLRKQTGDTLDLSVLQPQAADLLRQCDAHKFLRRVQDVLLGGKGELDFFEQAGKYDRVISLVWQGPVSQARKPNPEDPASYRYIFVGARGGKVYVNGKPLPAITPEALKSALVEGSKKPLVKVRSE